MFAMLVESLLSKFAQRATHERPLVAHFIVERGPVQCFAGYYDIKYAHLLDGEKQKGVIINNYSY